ncbi:hypothetical protein HDV06_000003 [Boothiomyces sp. JEL0866]|nr:hypothetical protein HDV06_000003 [Boothiomyces sp. JEL0866]
MTAIVFQSGWLNSFDCAGAPSTMYVFSEDTPPLVYANLATDVPLPICGCATTDVPIGCCVSSLDLSFTDNYQSVMRNYVNDWASFIPPTSANLNTYCTISTADYSSFQGMNQAYYLAKNQCIDTVICDIDSNTLTVYNNTGCDGFFETFSLSNSSQIQNSVLLGNVTIGLETIHNGAVNILWTAYSPQYELVPQLKIPSERFAAFCYCMSLLIGLTTSSFYLRKFYIHRNTRDLLFGITQLLISINISLQCVYYTTILSETQLSVLDIGVQVSSVYSLFSVYISLHILFTIFVDYQYTFVHKAVYFFFTALNVCTVYFYALADIYSLVTGQFNDVYFYLVRMQYYTQGYWKITYIVIEILPSIAILYKLIFRATNKKIQTLKAKINIIIGLAIFQIFLVLAYEAVILLRTYTLIYKNDRNALASSSSNYLIQTMNSLIVLIVYEKLVELLEKIANRKVQIVRKATSGSLTEVLSQKKIPEINID